MDPVEPNDPNGQDAAPRAGAGEPLWGTPPPGPAPAGTFPGYGPPGYGPPGYGPPGYGPPGYPGGYGQPQGYGAPGPAWVTPDDQTWAMLAHLSFFVFGILGPIVIMLTKGNERPFVRDQAVEALNFHITVMLAMLVSAILILVLVGIVLFLAVAVAAAVFTVMAAIAASRGQAYRYPVNIRFVH